MGFDIWSDRAKAAIHCATKKALTLNHGQLGTDHILYGLISDSSSSAARVLHRLGLDFEKLRKQIETNFRYEALKVPNNVPPLTDNAKKLDEHSIEIMGELGHRWRETDHLLLAIIRIGGSASRLLLEFGITYERVFDQLERDRSQAVPYED